MLARRRPGEARKLLCESMLLTGTGSLGLASAEVMSTLALRAPPAFMLG